ncbi:hypothetical protein ACA910_001486 [Epithemia clementina (nom. ined.)]
MKRAVVVRIDKPKRPLSAYNLFFQEERFKILATRPVRPEGVPLRRGHGKMGFAEMAKTIAAKWNAIESDLKVRFEGMARSEKIRYKQQVARWKKHVAFIKGKNLNKKFKKLSKNHKNKAGSKNMLMEDDLRSDTSNILSANSCSDSSFRRPVYRAAAACSRPVTIFAEEEDDYKTEDFLINEQPPEATFAVGVHHSHGGDTASKLQTRPCTTSSFQEYESDHTHPRTDENEQSEGYSCNNNNTTLIYDSSLSGLQCPRHQQKPRRSNNNDYHDQLRGPQYSHLSSPDDYYPTPSPSPCTPHASSSCRLPSSSSYCSSQQQNQHDSYHQNHRQEEAAGAGSCEDDEFLPLSAFPQGYLASMMLQRPRPVHHTTTMTTTSNNSPGAITTNSLLVGIDSLAQQLDRGDCLDFFIDLFTARGVGTAAPSCSSPRGTTSTSCS